MDVALMEQNIYFSGGVCSGGHGLSIGSVGGRSDNTVKNVTFYDSEIKSSQNGRFCIKVVARCDHMLSRV